MPFIAESSHMRQPDVIIPDNHPNPPEDHEVEAAWILARHFSTVVEYLIPVDGYKTKTNDVEIDGIIWEIKSPTGNSKTTVGNQFKEASKQRARNIVFDSRRTKLKDSVVLSRVRFEMKRRRSVKRVLFIAKDENVVEIIP